MADERDIEALTARGAGRPAPEAGAALYREAFARFGAHARWSRTPSAAPTITQALVVAQGLRNEGSMLARPLAAAIEEACRAAV